MASIGDLFLRLVADSKGFVKDVEVAAGKAGDKAGKRLSTNLGSEFKKGLTQGLGIAAFSSITGVVSGVTDAIGGSIQAASDFNETMSKSTAVFKDQAGEIDQWGDTAADKMGISKNAAIGAAAGFGDLFNKMDETRGASVEMSTELVQLASDLASFNNLDPTDVLDKLRAGLSGEAEPLRRVGVFLNEAKVQAKALELGFKPLNGKLTDGAKIAARYELIMEETASAQGDFVRTADGAANKQRILDARMADASATIGQKLLPVQLALTEAGIELVEIIDELSPVLDEAMKGVGFLADEVSDAIGPVFELAHAIDELRGLLPQAGDGSEQFGSTLDMVAYSLTHGGTTTGYYIDKIKELQEESEAAAKEQGDMATGQNTVREEFRATARTFVGATADVSEATEGAGASAEAFQSKVKANFEAAAEDARKPLESIGEKASAAALKVVGSMQRIVDAIQGARDTLTGNAQAAADAIYDPWIAKAELAATKIELAEARKVLATKKAGTAEYNEARLTVLNLEKQLVVQEANVAQYGDSTAKIAENKALIARIKASAEWKKGSDEQKAVLQQQVTNLTLETDRMERAASQGGKDIRDGYTGPIRQLPGQVKKPVDDTKAKVRELDQSKEASGWGNKTGNGFVNALRLSLAGAAGAARDTAATIGRILRQQSPAKEGPFSEGGGMAGWAETAGEDYSAMLAASLIAGISRIRAAVSQVAGAVHPSLMAPGITAPTRPLLSGPAYGNPAASIAPASTVLPAGGNTYHVHLEDKLPPARSPLDIGRALRDATDQGYIK